MSFRFTFGNVGSRTELRQTIDFLAKQGLGYRNYDSWVQKTESEIDLGIKTAIIALSEGKIVGDLIYHHHKILPGVIELKNLRIHPEIRGRYFAPFMLRQVECENPNCDLIMGDARSDQREIARLMLGSGYYVLKGEVRLYDKNNQDVVFMKQVGKNREIICKAKNLVLTQNLQ